MTAGNTRAAELSANLRALRERIAAACTAAGRPAEAVTLIAITKTFPAADVRLLARLGVSDVGENKDQEAAQKAAECADVKPPLRWHFVGQLQVNKAKSVVRYADVVHSVDRSRLIGALGSRASAVGRVVTCLIQVDLDPHPDPGRGGASPDDVPALAAEVAATSGLLLGGVMAIAPLGVPPRPAFRRLAEVADVVRAAYPAATMISAGMTGDLDEAIAEGATHVRVGTALLGSRRAFVR